MPFYSDEVVEKVREANDILDVISEYVHLKKSGANYFGLCPFHNEKSPSFSVNRDKQIYHCFGCGAGGDVFSFIRQYENMSFYESIKYLAERGGVILPENEMSAAEKARNDRRSSLLEINKQAARYFYKLMRTQRGADAHRYFADRGLSEETMRSFGLGYSDKYSDDLYRYLSQKGYHNDLLKESGLVTFDEKRGPKDKFWNRAMFPIMDHNSKVIAFGGRVMGEGKPKYLNSPETEIFNKSRTLYGLHIARRTREQSFILCEGYMDVISLHQAGFDNAVASLGTALTEGHASLIARYVEKVYLSYDSDGAGVKAALRAIPILREAGIDAKIINMEPYKDPDEFIKALGSDEYRSRIQNAENSFMFSVRMLEGQFNMRDPGDRSRFARAVCERIMEFSDAIERNNYRDAVAAKYSMKPEALEELIRKIAATGRKHNAPSAKSQDSKSKGDITRDRGDLHSQKLILRWLCEHPEMYKTTREYLQPSDFDHGVMEKIAAIVFGQLDAGQNVNTTAIISDFEQEDEISQVSAVFFEEVVGMSDDDTVTLHLAASQAIINIKDAATARQIESWNEESGVDFGQLIQENAKIRSLKGKNLFG